VALLVGNTPYTLMEFCLDQFGLKQLAVLLESMVGMIVLDYYPNLESFYGLCTGFHLYIATLRREAKER
jgi:hypothetical protein